METPIYFGGIAVPASGGSPSTRVASSIDHPFQEFTHYVATIWVHRNEVPTEREALTLFDAARLIPHYKLFMAAGGRVPTERGQTLEETWLSSQLFLKTPLLCLMNEQQPPQPSGRITRIAMLTPDRFVGLLQKAFPIRLNSHDITGQRRRWRAALSPIYKTLVFDGRTGHCVSLIGIDRCTGAFLYHDPWSGRSLLCRENNIAGVRAAPSPSGERFWLITPDDLQRVVYAVMMEVDDTSRSPLPPRPSTLPRTLPMVCRDFKCS